MKEKELEWEEVAERFVLYLDIGGFKDRVKSDKTSNLRQSLLDFRNKNIQLKPLLEGGRTSNKMLMKMTQFSDSIMVVSASNKLEDLNRITKAAVILMQIALETKFAIRGVIACGEMVFDEKNQLFFGQPLVDAYLLEQQMCHYGIIFHHTAEEIVKEAVKEMKAKGRVIVAKLKSDKECYIPIDDCLIQIKSGKSKHYQVLWHKMDKELKKGDISKEALVWLENLRTTVSGYPRAYLDNTVEFIKQN